MSNNNDLRKQSGKIVGLYKEAQKGVSGSLEQVVKIFNPSLDYLASLYAKSDKEKMRLAMIGTGALMQLSLCKIDEKDFVRKANDTIISRITKSAAIEEDEDEEVYEIPKDVSDFIEIPNKEKEKLSNPDEQTYLSPAELRKVIQRLYETNLQDEEAMSVLVNYVSSVAFKISVRSGLDASTAKDIGQEVVISIWKQLQDRSIDISRGPASYIGLAIKHKITDIYRERSGDKTVQIVTEEGAPNPYETMSEDESVESPEVKEFIASDPNMPNPEMDSNEINKHVKYIGMLMNSISPVMAFAMNEIKKGVGTAEISQMLTANPDGKYDDVLATMRPGETTSKTSLDSQLSRTKDRLTIIMKQINDARLLASSKGLRRFASIMRDNLRIAEAKEPESWEEVEDKSLERNREENGLDETAYKTIEAMLNEFRKDKDINVIADKYLEPARTERGWEPITEGRLEDEKSTTGTPLRNEKAWGKNIRPLDKQNEDREKEVKKETFNLKTYEQNMNTPNKQRILDKDIGVQLDLAKTTILDQVPDGFEPMLSKSFNLKKHKVASSPSLVRKVIHAELNQIIDLDRKIIAIASQGHSRSLTNEEKQQIDELKKVKVKAIGMENEKINAVAARYYLEKLAFDEEEFAKDIGETESNYKYWEKNIDSIRQAIMGMEEIPFYIPSNASGGINPSSVATLYANRPQLVNNIIKLYMPLMEGRLSIPPTSGLASA